jgi:hypothetical protein
MVVLPLYVLGAYILNSMSNSNKVEVENFRISHENTIGGYLLSTLFRHREISTMLKGYNTFNRREALRLYHSICKVPALMEFSPKKFFPVVLAIIEQMV